MFIVDINLKKVFNLVKGHGPVTEQLEFEDDEELNKQLIKPFDLTLVDDSIRDKNGLFLGSVSRSADAIE